MLTFFLLSAFAANDFFGTWYVSAFGPQAKPGAPFEYYVLQKENPGGNCYHTWEFGSDSSFLQHGGCSDIAGEPYAFGYAGTGNWQLTGNELHLERPDKRRSVIEIYAIAFNGSTLTLTRKN